MLKNFVPKSRSFVHLTSAANLEGILKNGIEPMRVPARPSQQNTPFESNLKGVFVNAYPDAFDLLPFMFMNVFPVALKIETTENCEIFANDGFVHDEYLHNISQNKREDALKEQAQFVFKIYGSTVLSSALDSWRITGMQTFDACIFRHSESQRLEKQRQQLLDLVKHCYFRTMLRIPLNHAVSHKGAGLTQSLCEETPFVPFNTKTVNAFFDRCGGKNAVINPSKKLLGEKEIESLKGAPDSIIRYIKSYPEPLGVTPPKFGPATAEASAAFDSYAKAKFLQKPPPPPPVTYKLSPQSGQIKIDLSKKKGKNLSKKKK